MSNPTVKLLLPTLSMADMVPFMLVASHMRGGRLAAGAELELEGFLLELVAWRVGL